MVKVIYYTRPNKRQPAKEWIDAQDSTIQNSIDVMREKLEREDPDLLIDNGMLVRIREKPGGKIIPGFYELKKYRWRIAVYYDKRKNVFVMMSGWLKKKNVQQDDVNKAISFLREYQATEGR